MTLSAYLYSQTLSKGSSVADGIPTNTVARPVENGSNFIARRAVPGSKSEDKPENNNNTMKTMAPKMAEYHEFCEYAYPSDLHPHTLTADKVYRFMFYVSFRDKKPTGGRRARGPSKKYFECDAYEKVMVNFRFPESGENAVFCPTPEKPIGPATFSMYKACFRSLYSIQVASKMLSTPWDRIWNMHCETLANQVKARAPKKITKKKDLFQEKVNHEFSTTLVEHDEDSRLESVLPEVNQRLSVTQDSIQELIRNQATLQQDVTALVEGVQYIRSQPNEWKGQFNSVLQVLSSNQQSTGSGQISYSRDAVPQVQSAENITGSIEEVDAFLDSISSPSNAINHNDVPALAPMQLMMLPKHPTLASMYNEWYGKDLFADSEGGVDGRNRKYGRSWRRDSVNKQHYSRTCRIITAIESLSKRTNRTIPEAIAALEPLYASTGPSLSKTVDLLMEKGYIPKGKPRSLKRKSPNEPEETITHFV